MQSGNARSYQNSIVPFFNNMLSISTGIFVSRCIQTETGSGKCMINGHFAKMMNIVHAYVDAGFNVCTPSQLACALNYNDGGYNCIVEVIKHDHIDLNALIAEYYVGIKSLKNLSRRTNEFGF